MNEISTYEKDALAKIHEWKDPSLSRLDKALSFAGMPMDKAADLITKVPGVSRAVEKSVGRIMSVANDVAQWSVRSESILKEYRSVGHEVESLEDIRKLDLEEVDKAIGRLAAKYEALSVGEGVATGFTGIFGVPADVAALAALNLRAIGEYATYCGFDVALPEEKLFAMSILELASSPDSQAKKKALSQLVRVARDAATKTLSRNAHKSAMAALVERIARTLGVRLTYDKVAQFLPVAGAIVGGGTNGIYTAKVCKGAHNLYRERFLAEKYGSELIELTVEPAEFESE